MREQNKSTRKMSQREALYEYLKNKIMYGDIPARCPLPSTDILIKEFGVGRSTIQRAITALEKDGLIERRAGSGCYVLPPKDITLTDLQLVTTEKLKAILTECKDCDITRREIDFIVDNFYAALEK